MAINYITQSLDDAVEMLRARVALKILAGKEYQNEVDSWKPVIRDYVEKQICTNRGLAITRVAREMTAIREDVSHAIQIWAAALEILEEEDFRISTIP